MKSTTQKSGFTLVELAIVLVIIGLIVGGVLVGQDLIKAAQIRAAVGQLDKFDAAANAFRGKYNGMPGDLANCSNFFLAADCATSGTTAGNSALEDTAGTKVLLSGEPVAVWKHLYDAGYIGDAITNTSNILGTTATSGQLANIFPASKVGSAAYFVAYTVGTAVTYPGFSGSNSYRLAGLTIAAGVPTFTNPLSPLEAFQLDTKKDDGVANSGIVQGTDQVTGTNFNLAADAATGTGTGKCMYTPSTYNTSTSDGSQNSRLCQVMVRASW